MGSLSFHRYPEMGLPFTLIGQSGIVAHLCVFLHRPKKASRYTSFLYVFALVRTKRFTVLNLLYTRCETNVGVLVHTFLTFG